MPSPLPRAPPADLLHHQRGPEDRRICSRHADSRDFRAPTALTPPSERIRERCCATKVCSAPAMLQYYSSKSPPRFPVPNYGFTVTKSRLEFEWTRYWCPRDEGEIRIDERGYLVDPSGKYGGALNPHLVTWDSLLARPCLVLLGEPGIGKSSTIRAWKTSIESTSDTSTAFHWLDIAGYSEERLRRRLLEAPEVRRWADGSGHLRIVIDSYDECGIPHLGTILAEDLETLPLDRLSLAIACRTLVWPASFESELRRMWGESALGVYALTPLTYRNVVAAAQAEFAHSAGDFLQEVDRLGIGSLASKPLTLEFLIKYFRAKGRLPDSQVEIYEHGYRLLAAETNQRRLDAGEKGICTPEHRLAIACRIAAVLTFANRDAVWTGIEDASVPDGDVTVAGLTGGTEPAREDSVPATDQAVRETLSTGLFSDRGIHRMGFWHQAAADFLAARYIRERQLDADQAMSLLLHPSDQQGRIAPRLRSAAAWVAALLPTLLPRIAAADPEAIINSDVEITDPEIRVRMVDTVLRMFDREELVLGVLGPFYRLDRLAHSDLADQLRPWITARSESEGRVAALEIAKQCEVHELESEVLAVALNPSEPERIRVRALIAAGSVVAPERLSVLRPLAFSELGEDPRDQLKGFALQLLFPAHLSLEETLAAITTPRDSSLSGAYEHFLASELPSNVKDEDLAAALRWIAAEDRAVGLFATRHTADVLMRRAWLLIDQDPVRDALAAVAWSRLKHDERVFSRQFFNDEDTVDPMSDTLARRRMLAGLVPLIRDAKRDSFHLLHGHAQVIHSEDVPWMVEQAETDVPHASTWAYLVWQTANVDNASHANAIVEAAERVHAIREKFAWALGALDLDDPITRKIKVEHLRREREIRRSAAQRKKSPFTPTAPEVERLLSETETSSSSGSLEASAFWQLVHVLRYQPDGRHGAAEHVLDFPELPGWQAADPATQHRIVAAARTYVQDRVPYPEPKALDGIHSRPEAAGYMAFRLLANEDPDVLGSLGGAVWERWTPTLVALEGLFGIGQRDLTVLKYAKASAPQTFANALEKTLEREIERSGRAWMLDDLKELVDETGLARIAAWLSGVQDRPDVYRGLLRPLLERNSPEAFQIAVRTLSLPLPSDDVGRSVAVESARALLAFALENSWPVIWNAIQADRQFATWVLVSSLESFAEVSSLTKLSSQRLADLYIWLAQRTDSEPHDSGADAQPTRFERFESRVLDLLTSRSDPETITAIRRIAEALPNRRWLQRTIRRVEARHMDEEWVAPAPIEVLALDGRRHNRLVRNESQLAAAIMVSFGRLQQRLAGPNAPTFSLWDRQPAGWRPKEEERLSDFIADHLNLDLAQHGFIINREVEIRAKQGGAPGEIPDILVSASVPGQDPGSNDTISVVVEVKGCWHPHVLTAMRAQLVERYLRTSRSHAGIYCVGWYMCPQWDTSDRRRNTVPEMTLDELRQTLSEQARELSDGTQSISAFVLDAALP
jgi:hypothetical protein